jgi:hypothetical protein
MPRHARARNEAGDPYPELRELLAPELAGLAPEHLADLFARGGGSAEDLESFWSSFKEIGGQVGGVLKNALPGVVQGAKAGMALGPLGALAGAVAGGTLSAATRSSGGGEKAARLAGGGAPAGAVAALAGGSPAAARLLQMITRPELVKALVGMALGGAGLQQVPVGGMPVPVGAFTNLLGTLSQTAAAEYHERVAGEAVGLPLYLLNDAGELIVDPADPVERAGVLLRLFEADPGGEAAEDGASGEEWDGGESWDPEDLEDLWDEMELAALAFEDEEA